MVAAGERCHLRCEEVATVTPWEECSRKKGQGVRRLPGGQGIGMIKGRMPGWLWHHEYRCGGVGRRVSRDRSGKVLQTRK